MSVERWQCTSWKWKMCLLGCLKVMSVFLQQKATGIHSSRPCTMLLSSGAMRLLSSRANERFGEADAIARFYKWAPTFNQYCCPMDETSQKFSWKICGKTSNGNIRHYHNVLDYHRSTANCQIQLDTMPYRCCTCPLFLWYLQGNFCF